MAEQKRKILTFESKDGVLRICKLYQELLFCHVLKHLNVVLSQGCDFPGPDRDLTGTICVSLLNDVTGDHTHGSQHQQVDASATGQSKQLASTAKYFLNVS